MDHAVVVFVGVGIEQDAVDNAEDGGGGADAEHEREHRGDDEAGRFAELAEGEAEILHERVH